MCVQVLVAGVPTRGPVVVLVLCAYPWAMCVLGARGQVAGAVGVLFLVASASPKPHHQIERPPVGVLVRPPLSRWPAWCSCRCWVGWCRWACHQTMCPPSAQVVPPKLGAHFPVPDDHGPRLFGTRSTGPATLASPCLSGVFSPFWGHIFSTKTARTKKRKQAEND